MPFDRAATASRPAAPRAGLWRLPAHGPEPHSSAPPASGLRSQAHELEATLLLEARTGNADARARLIKALTPLIGSVARTYCHVPGIDRAELIQEGVVGVLRALERFNPDLGPP